MLYGRCYALMIGFFFWTLVGLFFSTHSSLITARFLDPNVRFIYAVVDTMPEWYLWGVFTPAIYRLVARYPLGRMTWRWTLPIQLGVGAIIVALHALLSSTIVWLFWAIMGRDLLWTNVIQDKISLFLHWNLLAYAAIFAVISAVNYYRRWSEREAVALRLKAELAQAQLDTLKSQLNPHFLFNSLNGIAELIHEAPDVAEQMLLRLGNLLRATLTMGNRQETSLADELNFIKNYLDIQQMRFQDQLSIHWDIDPSLLRAKVPSLILQPLVENTIHHALTPRTKPGHISIRASRDNGELRLEIADDGAGLNMNGHAHLGIGLKNTQSRLERLYGEHGKLQLTSAIAGGTQATVTMPYCLFSDPPAN